MVLKLHETRHLLMMLESSSTIVICLKYRPLSIALEAFIIELSR